MRSELGKISLDSVFAERDALNANVVAAIQPAAEAWGLRVLRYEIKDIVPPAGVRAAMELQAEAERRKRAEVLQSEGVRQATINRAEAGKQAVILASEAAREDQANRATGEAEAILRRAEATAAGVGLVAAALQAPGGPEAVALRVAEQYVDAFGKIAKEGTTVLLPAQAGDPAAMVAQAMSIFGRLGPGGAGSGGGGGGGNGGIGGNGGSGGVGAGGTPAVPRPAPPAPRADEGAPRPAFSLARK
jgi:regulator of protease activity HflC (stomatin/prohibitin superfamily)